MAETQRRVGICAFIDAEHAMDRGTPIGPASTSSCSSRSPTRARRRWRMRTSSLAPAPQRRGGRLGGHSRPADRDRRRDGRLPRRVRLSWAGHAEAIATYTNQLRERIAVMFGNPEPRQAAGVRGATPLFVL